MGPVNGLALAVWLAAAPQGPTPQQRAVDGALPVAQRVAAIDAVAAAARKEDFQALVPLRDTEDPALVSAYLRFLAVVPEPESIETAKGFYARQPDAGLRALAIAAVQPKLLGAPDDAVAFLASVFVQEQTTAAEPVRVAALKKLGEVGTPAAALAALRDEPQTEAELLAQLDALHALKAHAPPRALALARQHAKSPRPKVAEKAKALVAALSVRK